MGIKFKNPKTKLITMPACAVKKKNSAAMDSAGLKLSAILAMAAHSMAMSILTAGPAAATFTMSRRGFLKRRSLMGTGLAQPKAK